MKNTVFIEDDFSLKKIADSGQCFRCMEIDDGLFRFIKHDNVLYIRKPGCNDCSYEVSCDIDEWNEVWHDYFDLDRNYSSIRSSIPDDDSFLVKAAAYGAGIRMLKQDPWEMLISFIISQRKSIPAIRQAVGAFCEKYGDKITTDYETLYLFPTPKQAMNATAASLRECKVGYRDEYILDAINRVNSGKLNLKSLNDYNNDELLDALISVKGVGVKVANCIALFAYSRLSLAPVDTWIKKVIEKKYDGISPFDSYGELAGLMQQYMFYYCVNTGEI